MGSFETVEDIKGKEKMIPKLYYHKGIKLYLEPYLNILHLEDACHRPNTTLCKVSNLRGLKLLQKKDYPVVSTRVGVLNKAGVSICKDCLENFITAFVRRKDPNDMDLVVASIFLADVFESYREEILKEESHHA